MCTCSTKFYDELRGRSVGEGSKGEESSVDRPSINDNEEETMIRQTAVETKILELSNISVEVGGVGEGKPSLFLFPPLTCLSLHIPLSFPTSHQMPRIAILLCAL